MFSLPAFNITCDIYTGPWLGKVFRVSSDANLAYGRRATFGFSNFPDWTSSVGATFMTLLLPALTDIRSGLVAATPDIVEIPAGSQRWYQVAAVDDIGKAFSNEHRCAIVTGISHFANPTVFAGCVWPVPMP